MRQQQCWRRERMNWPHSVAQKWRRMRSVPAPEHEDAAARVGRRDSRAKERTAPRPSKRYLRHSACVCVRVLWPPRSMCVDAQPQHPLPSRMWCVVRVRRRAAAAAASARSATLWAIGPVRAGRAALATCEEQAERGEGDRTPPAVTAARRGEGLINERNQQPADRERCGADHQMHA